MRLAAASVGATDVGAVGVVHIHPFLSFYDGMEWKSISGDFSDGVDPVGLQTLGTTIYYLYGDGTNLNALEEPRAVKTMKLSPQ